MSVYSKILYLCVLVLCTQVHEYDVCDVTLSVHPHRASWKVNCLATVGIEPATFGILRGTDITEYKATKYISGQQLVAFFLLRKSCVIHIYIWIEFFLKLHEKF
jgi:hypothetical protein